MSDENQVLDQVSDPEGQSEPILETPVVDNFEGEVKLAEETTQVPRKFVGKTTDDIIKDYTELERELGRLRSEVGEKNKRIETLAQPAQNNQPVAQADIQNYEQQLMAEYEKDWREDPKQAVPNLLTKVERVKQYQNNYTQQVQLAEAAFKGQVPGMEDFAELHPMMTDVAKEFLPLLNPALETHPKALQAVYLMTKGLASTDKLNKTQSQLKSVNRNNKLEAYAESPSVSQGSDNVDFSSLSLKDMEKLLGTVDRSVEG